MGKFIDMTGWVMAEHGVVGSRITVIKRVENYISPNGKTGIQWLCECNCGLNKKFVLRSSALKRTKSCGCIQKEHAAEHCKKFHKTNIYDLTSYKYGVGLTLNTNKKFYFDLEDYDKIKDYCWSEQKESKSQYTYLIAREPNTNKLIKMSYLIFGKYCDHINRNALDNRKENLRDANYSQNAINRSRPSNNKSGIIGVHWDKKELKWVAQINGNGKRIRIGDYDIFNDAVVARLNAELKYYGKDFALQRHLFEEYGIC